MRASLTFRKATLADVDDVVELVQSAYRGESSKTGWTTEADLLAGQRTDANAVRDVIESPNAHFVLATNEAGELVGCCQLESREGGVSYFGSFAVRPATQGGGIGKQLLAEAERQARDESGAQLMEMTVIAQREDLIAWYRRRGYETTAETRPFPYGDERFGLPLRDDLVFVVLRKELAAGVEDAVR
jgi:N-acetylglutamate synthase-like GNAT family acetyltransferase